MELWLDASIDGQNVANGSTRVWEGRAHDVAEVVLDDHRAQEEALSLIGMVPWVLVRCSDWTMIPLENLVAASRGSGTRIAVAITNEVDLAGAAFALEHGVDAILVTDDLWEAAREMAEPRESSGDSSDSAPASVATAAITSIESGGVGERVCIDLIERLDDGEGIAIGSVAEVLCLVHGETVPSDYVPTRPFRVNAGAVHSYALMADGSTRYLSELSAGEDVAIVSSDGSRRSATIGRLKIERRPFLLVRYLSGDSEGQIIAQQAETVRLVTPSGGQISITDAAAGDEISILCDQRMRHMGIALEGGMVEK
ncbi:MAG: 3-dehydroquinate synthase II [Euryarchaeota archaeon]|nr:3-dehydroquinate synthase II [Euryarchaeota archaeon]|tara:strand:- start:1412 stop:2347 length:936 start_codon:yes stop_codon:yes gene_type:complete